MPEVTVQFLSHRGRPITDPVGEVRIRGSYYVHPLDIDKGTGALSADLVPGRYTVGVEVDGFRALERPLRAVMGQPATLSWRLHHRWRRLPRFRDLDSEQKRLFKFFAVNGPVVWNTLSDNQAYTFYQVTYVLSRTEWADGWLSECFDKVQRVGGAQIVGRPPTVESSGPQGGGYMSASNAGFDQESPAISPEQVSSATEVKPYPRTPSLGTRSATDRRAPTHASRSCSGRVGPIRASMTVRTWTWIPGLFTSQLLMTFMIR